MVDLSVILVNWNTRDVLLQCIESLYANPPGRSWDIWLVDNGSEDGSAEAVRERFPQVHLIRNERKVSFTAANNQAIEASASRYLLILNVDTVALPGCLESTCAYLDSHPEVGAVGCRLLNADGTHQRSCWRGFPGIWHALIEALYLWRLFPTLVSHSEVILSDPREPVPVDHLLGAYILAPRHIVESVGCFDTGYYLYMDETDLCLRIRRAGYPIMYLPEPRTIHLGQATQHEFPAATLPLFYRSYCRFIRKRGGSLLGLRMLVVKAVLALGILVRLCLWSVRMVRRRSLSQRMLVGYAHVLRQLPSL